MGWSQAPGDPQLEQWQSQQFNAWLPKTPAERWGRRMLTKFKEGADVSDYGELAGVRQLGATQGAGVDMNYMTGANRLLSENGNPEDVSQMNRQRDLAHQRVNQQTGQNEVAALGNLQHEALSASDPTQRWALNSANQNAAMNNRNSYYQSRLKYNAPFWQSLLLAGIGGASTVAGGFAGRPSSPAAPGG